MESIYNIDHQTLCNLLHEKELSSPLSTTDRVFHHFYRERKKGQLPDGRISRKAMLFLSENFSFDRPQVILAKEALDQTVKFLIEFQDGQRVETVLLPFPGRYTVCLSTQVGCAMNCSFCFTGTQGLKRHLTPGEIIGQYLIAWEWLEHHRPQHSARPKIVLMGQGEPLHNFEAVKKAIQIMVGPKGMQMGARRITLSTAGYLPGLRRFKELPAINLALSLHSPFNSIRSEIIPLNKTYPLEQVLEAVDQVPLKCRQFINFEYLLMDGLNNREEDAHQLGRILLNKKGIINLIPFNEFPGSVYKRPSDEKVISFQKLLTDIGFIVTIRKTKGSDILAACGQLKSKKN